MEKELMCFELYYSKSFVSILISWFKRLYSLAKSEIILKIFFRVLREKAICKYLFFRLVYYIFCTMVWSASIMF